VVPESYGLNNRMQRKTLGWRYKLLANAHVKRPSDEGIKGGIVIDFEVNYSDSIDPTS